MTRDRRTVSFEPEVSGVIDDIKARKSFSTYVNDKMKETIDPKALDKKRKQLEKEGKL